MRAVGMLASLAAAVALFPALYAHAAAIVVDGRKVDGEWSAASHVEQGGVILSRMLEADALYFAIEPQLAYPVYVDLYFADESGDVVNLHASQKIGQRHFASEARDEDRPAFAWGPFQDWEANVGSPQANGNVYEFRVSRAMLGGRDVRLRVEVQDFYGRNPPVVFPHAASPQLPATWIRLWPCCPRAAKQPQGGLQPAVAARCFAVG